MYTPSPSDAVSVSVHVARADEMPVLATEHVTRAPVVVNVCEPVGLTVADAAVEARVIAATLIVRMPASLRSRKPRRGVVGSVSESCGVRFIVCLLVCAAAVCNGVEAMIGDARKQFVKSDERS